MARLPTDLSPPLLTTPWKKARPPLNFVAAPGLRVVRSVAAVREWYLWDMTTPSSADAGPVRPSADLPTLSAAARSCTACDLYRYATQTVFGEGPPSAPVVMVGEQPGDREDIEGRPFVGPAGRVLEQAMEEAGLNSAQVYLTNAVKHFR